MRSAECFVREVHRRAAVLCRRSVKRQIMLLSAVSAGLMISLSVLICEPHRISRVTMAGSSLLDESAGGYVAVAVLSFMLGAVIAFFLHRYLQKRGARRKEKGKNENQT